MFVEVRKASAEYEQARQHIQASAMQYKTLGSVYNYSAIGVGLSVKEHA